MLKISHLYKTYDHKEVLKDITLNFSNSGLVVILGKSGSGKTTLLNMLSGYEKSDSGEIVIDGKSLNDFNEKDFNNYRSNYINYIFQDSYLLEDFSINDNLMMVLNNKNINSNLIINKALEKVGLSDIGHKICKDLSGGQKQRVSIARSLVKDNKIILADEPTGSLDSKNSEEIFSLLKEISKEKLVIVVTHNRNLAFKFANRVIEIKDGVIHSDLTKISTPKNVKLNNNVLKVEQGSKVDKKTLESIVNNKEGYLGVSDNLDKLVIAHPDLLDYKNEESLDFKESKVKIKSNNEYKCVDNKLSNYQIIKLAKNSKVHRKKYNLLIAFLSLFAAFLIISVNLSSLSLSKYVTTNHNDNLIEISKITTRINQDDLNDLDEVIELDSVGFSIDYKLTPLFANLNEDSEFVSKEFSGIIEGNNLGYSLLEGNDNYSNNYEIVITDYMASLFIEYGVLTKERVYYATSYKDLINKEIYIDETGSYYKIIGIYKSDYFSLLEEYLLSGKSDKSEIVNNIDFVYSKVFAKKDFYKQYKHDYKDLYFYQDNEIFVTNLVSENKDYTFYFSDTRLLLNKEKVNDATLYDLNGNEMEIPETLNDNEIIISIECIYEMFKEKDISISTLLDREDIHNVISDDELKISLFKNNETGADIKVLNEIKVKVVGVFNKGNRVFLSKNIYDYVENSLSGYDSVYLNQNYSKVVLENKLEELNDLGYYFGTNSFKCEKAINFLNTISVVKSVFLSLSLVSFAFVFLLSLNYLMMIVRSRKKELALYRINGVSKSDVYKIFSLDTIKLVIKSLLISVILSYVLSKLLNSVLNSLESLKDYVDNLINISFFNVLFVFVIVLLALMLLSYLALRRILNESALKLLKEE